MKHLFVLLAMVGMVAAVAVPALAGPTATGDAALKAMIASHAPAGSIQAGVGCGSSQLFGRVCSVSYSGPGAGQYTIINTFSKPLLASARPVILRVMQHQ